MQNALNINRVFWVLLILFCMFSLLLVYSSVVTLAYRYHQGDAEFYLLKHALILLFGLALCYFVQQSNFVFFGRISGPLYILAVILLIITLFKGVSVGEASRWLEIPGTNLSFQPSDPAKLILILFTGRNLVKYKEDMIPFKRFLIRFILPAAVMFLLIFPVNLSTAVLLMCNVVLLVWVAGAPHKNIFFLFLLSLLAAGIIVGLIWFFPQVIPRGQTWKSRIESYVGKKEKGNYQAEQAKIAIASGGVLWGKGPGKSIQRAFLPQASSDFIFAILVEEYGILISVFVMLLYIILFYRCLQIYHQSPNEFGSIITMGISIGIVFQAFINMLVAVNLIPVTGQPLPLISMGGTSIWFTMISLGLIMSVNLYTHRKKNRMVEADQSS